MKVLALSGLLMLFGNAYAQVLHDGDLYSIGTRVKTVRSDTILSRDALRVNAKERPNAPVFGHIVGARLSSSLRHLEIRCTVKTGKDDLRLVLARLVVESYDPEYLSYWQLETFNIAIVDTIPSNETRAYLFKHYLDIMNNTGSQMLWNYYRQSSNPKSFRWLFEPVFVRRIN